MREKLIELLSENFCEYCNVDIIAGHCKIRAITFDADKFADHLIANGVTIPVRCKDCKHYDKDALWCNINSPMFSEEHYNWYEDDFCSCGERKTE